MDDLTAVITRGQEIYEQAMETCEQNINTWKMREQEYLDLAERLELFSRKISHDVMVPFGKVGFMPGRLVHTNEVLVLLGDNWFAVRSTYQAKEIIDRRLTYVKEMIKKYEEELKSYYDKLGMAKQFLIENATGDYFEIREPVPATTSHSKKTRIAHKPSSRQAGMENVSKDGSVPSTETRSVDKKVSDKEFLELMAKLDELDRDDNGEDSLPVSRKPLKHLHDGHAEPQILSSHSGRKVKWQDGVSKDPDSADSSVVADSHTERSSTSEQTAVITKSILKNRNEITPVGELPPSPYEERVKTVASVSREVFRTEVVERIPTDTSATSTSEPPRRLSKFAQERARLKKD